MAKHGEVGVGAAGAPLTALILAGGLGTRLRAAVADRPKVLAPVAGRPFIEFLLLQLARAGVTDVVLAAGHLADQLAAACGDGSRFGLRIHLSVEDRPLGTAGALKLAAPLIRSNPFLMMNGDSYTDVDLAELLQFHRGKSATASLLLVEVPDCGRFGSVALDGKGAVTKFGEKQDAGPGFINAGIYALDPSVLARIPSGRAVSMETDLLPQLIGAGLYGMPRKAAFIDIGTPASFAEAQRVFRKAGLDRPEVAGSIVMLDRDGTVIAEEGYLRAPEDLRLLPGAAAGIRKLRSLGMPVVLVSNQAAIGRGHLAESTLHAIHARLAEVLAAEGAALDGIYFCPHLPDAGCACRKPAPGMLEQALRDFGADPARSFMVGDNTGDIEAGRRVGATAILVRTGHGQEVLAGKMAAPDLVAGDLGQAAHLIEKAIFARKLPA